MRPQFADRTERGECDLEVLWLAVPVQLRHDSANWLPPLATSFYSLAYAQRTMPSDRLGKAAAARFMQNERIHSPPLKLSLHCWQSVKRHIGNALGLLRQLSWMLLHGWSHAGQKAVTSDRCHRHGTYPSSQPLAVCGDTFCESPLAVLVF